MLLYQTLKGRLRVNVHAADQVSCDTTVVIIAIVVWTCSTDTCSKCYFVVTVVSLGMVILCL